MTRNLQKDDAGTDVIQFRGRQTSVTLEAAGLPPVQFGTEQRHGMVCHRAYPVVDPDTDPDDAPDDGILQPVAREIVESSPLVAYGVACEVEDCDEVFDTPRGEASHYGAVHADGDQDTDDETEESTIDQSATDTKDDTGEA